MKSSPTPVAAGARLRQETQQLQVSNGDLGWITSFIWASPDCFVVCDFVHLHELYQVM
jgi:hypothetical protein